MKETEKRLSPKNHWNLIYTSTSKPSKRETPHSLPRTIKNLIKRVAGDYLYNYRTYLFWDVVFSSYLPKIPGLRVLEVGSAPGDNLVRLHKIFKYETYGVDYSEEGAELNRQTFRKHGIDPGHVIQADFFSEAFQTANKESFDIVFSAGFIEHFTNVEEVIEQHLALLRQGGYLVISIPRLTGINYPLGWFFNREVLPMHNLNIMSKRSFAALFDRTRLQWLYCDYIGTFDFKVFEEKYQSRLVNYIFRCCLRLQLLLNVLFRLILRTQGAESGLWSPYLLFVGIKK